MVGMFTVSWCCTQALGALVDANPARCVEADVLHRGVRAQNWFEPGESVTVWEFVSTSSRAQEGRKFTGLGREKVVTGTFMQIHGGCGVSIKDVSKYESENEVLLLPGAHIDVRTACALQLAPILLCR